VRVEGVGELGEYGAVEGELVEVGAVDDRDEPGERLVAPHPLPEVPTVEDVRAHPDYWIAGPGRLVAERTRCAHDYFLTDSCPCC
jgi:hypothetical protein